MLASTIFDFDVEHDCNDEINQFFDFMLNMTDEQIHYMMTDESKDKLDQLSRFYINHSQEDQKQQIKTDKMKIKNLLH